MVANAAELGEPSEAYIAIVGFTDSVLLDAVSGGIDCESVFAPLAEAVDDAVSTFVDVTGKALGTSNIGEVWWRTSPNIVLDAD